LPQWPKNLSALNDAMRALKEPPTHAAHAARVAVASGSVPSWLHAITEETEMPHEFGECTDGAYADAAVTWASSGKQGPPPLNPEQRAAARRFYGAFDTRECALRHGATHSEAAEHIAAHLSLVTGPGGSGKSELIRAVRGAMADVGHGPLVITAYTGVAAAPFGGATLMRLFSIPCTGEEASGIRPGAAGAIEWRARFAEETGLAIGECGGLVIDEISFVTTSALRLVDERARAMLDVDMPFGGLPVMLAGDNFQKTPPSGTPWYRKLVASALGEGGNASPGELHALALLRAAPRTALTRNMRAADDPFFARLQAEMRDTRAAWPVPAALLNALRPVSAADLRDDESWRFAPIGVLSHTELDAINPEQVHAFARTFGLAVLRWKLPLNPTDALPIDPCLLDELYDNEPGLWGYFVQGAPALLTENVKSTRKLVNGSPCLLHSVTFRGDVPQAVSDAFESEQYAVVTLDEPPEAVNVRVSGGTWHGVKLGDFDELVRVSDALAAGVVPVVGFTRKVAKKLGSIFAAQNDAVLDVRVKVHTFQLAFALTDFKL
jgi:energy-coupling factor transporter ATP-binding protein EcfA2